MIKQMLDIEKVNEIKRIAIIALASDDTLVETLVLKGGNAIDLAYKQNEGFSRSSYDLDYSIDNGDFQESMAERIEATLKKTYQERGYTVIDYKFGARPKKANEKLADFWGGYKAVFKVIPTELYEKEKDNPGLRNKSIMLNPDRSPVFELEFSKFEFVENKVPVKVDGYTVYVYTPEMIVFEKIRALCQQLPGYAEIIPSFSPRARARDFYDIHLIMEGHKIDPSTPDNIELIRNIFSAKKVPISFIQDIPTSKAFHAEDWKSVTATLPRNITVESFDFYFDYVMKKYLPLKFP
jgi:predicted nucleotidyltransferase component of viral defense system